jgi:hypothetical protein
MAWHNFDGKLRNVNTRSPHERHMPENTDSLDRSGQWQDIVMGDTYACAKKTVDP